MNTTLNNLLTLAGQIVSAILFATLLTLTYHMVATHQKKKKAKTIKQLKDKLWKLVSFYVRKSAADFQGNVSCYTCGKYGDYREFHCGHFIPKSVGGAALYFNLDNLRVQCVACNTWLSGNLSIYSMKLEAEKPGILKQLNDLRGQPWDRRELERLIEKFTILTKPLR